MSKKVSVLALTILALALWGCGNKLTEETASSVIEEEILAPLNERGFTRVAFEKGSKGFDYFQKLITDGTFHFEKEEKGFDILVKDQVVKIYAPKPDLAKVFGSLEIKDDMVLKDPKMEAIFDPEKSLKRRTVCEANVKIKKKVLKSIESILNDEKNGTAVVKFTIAEVGVSPYYDDLCPLMSSDAITGSGECNLRVPYHREVHLKRYDEGWHIK